MVLLAAWGSVPWAPPSARDPVPAALTGLELFQSGLGGCSLVLFSFIFIFLNLK